MVIESKDPSKGHPIILGRPWLDTEKCFYRMQGWRDDYFQWVVYTETYFIPLSTTNNLNSWWLNCSLGDEDFDDLSLPSDFSWALQEQTTKNVLNQFVSSTTYTDFPQSFAQLDQIFGDEFQENMALSMFTETPCVFTIEEHTGP